MAVRETHHAQPSAATRPSALQPVMVGLAVAAALELVILRTFTRTAIHIPALQSLSRPYELLSDLGQYTYYVAAVLVRSLLCEWNICWSGKGSGVVQRISLILHVFASVAA